MVKKTVKYFGPMASLTDTLWENMHTRSSLDHGFASYVAHVYYRDVSEAKYIDLVNKRICIEFNENNLNWCEGTMPLGDGVFNLSMEQGGT